MMPPMHMMKMFFHSNTSDLLLFKGLRPSSGGIYFLCLVGLCVVTLLKEYLFFYRRRLICSAAPPSRTSSPAGGAAVRYDGMSGNPKRSAHLPGLDAVLYAFNLTLGYTLMLAVMTYNLGYFFAVVVSSGAGHYLFGRIEDLRETASEPEAECCEAV